MSTARAERATGHAAVSAAGVTQHSKKNSSHDKSESTRSLSIRCYAQIDRLNGGVRGLFGSDKSPRLKASPSDDLECYLSPTSPRCAQISPPLLPKGPRHSVLVPVHGGRGVPTAGPHCCRAPRTHL